MSKYVFTCHRCGLESGYTKKKPGEIVLEFKPGLDVPEQRIYECECCGAENEIENTDKEWTVIEMVDL